MSEAAAQRWQNKPDGSNWGEFGSDDQIGRLNYITPEVRQKAVAEVKAGLAFCLSLPLDVPGGNVIHPLRHPPHFSAMPRGNGRNYNFPLANEKSDFIDVVSDDVVSLATQYSTHWDGLAHIGQEFDIDQDGNSKAVYYNGFRAGEDVIAPSSDGQSQTRKLGIENMAASCVQGRGVLLDLVRHLGSGRIIVGYDELMRVIEADGIAVERGDILCLHTGFTDLLLRMNKKPDREIVHPSQCAELDGRDERLLQWIDDSEISAIASDNIGVEALPARPADGTRYAALPLHECCLFKLGIHLGELWYLSELAAWLNANERRHFLLTAPPLRLPGAAGSPVTPIATV